ncbi:MAG: general secretion pathway protein GspK [Sphingomonadaceae bacterium]
MTTAPTSRRGEDGYTLIAAVASILFFAVIALGVLALTQRTQVAAEADIAAARASAAADAGVALGIRSLLMTDVSGASAIDGRPRRVSFDGATLAIQITDERGKVPLNLLDDQQLTALLEFSGLSGDPLAIARDSFLDWIDDDDEPRANGAEYDYYQPQGIRPRNSGLLTLGELGRVRGFTTPVVTRIAAVATTDFGNGPFDTRFALPQAIRIMYPDGDAAVAEIVRTREAEGQTAAFEGVDSAALIGRPMTILVRASFRSGAAAERRCVVELTGARVRPYVIRHCR